MKKLLIPCCLVLLAGCVDKDYDKEIDMNVTIAENGITLPVGETDKFTLSKLIDTDDNLKINGDSIYYISESTDSKTEFAAMKSVIIDQSNGLAPEIEPTEIAIPEELEQAIELGIPYEGSIPLTLSADVPINPSQLKVSKDIERIDTIMFDSPKQATLTFTTELFEDQGPAEFSLLLSDMKVTLPQMLILSNTDKIGDTVLEETDDMGNPLVVRDHILYVPSKNAEDGIFSITLNIYGLCAGKIRPAQTQVRTDFIIEELEITRVAGLIDASADESFSIEIGSMPDFLSGNDISLDLSNPFIKLNAANPMGIPVKAVLSIDPKNDKGVSLNPEPIVVDTIFIKQASYSESENRMIPSENHIYISQREPTNDWVDAEKKTFWLNDTLYTWAQGNLPGLLDTQIPSSLDATISASTDKSIEHIALLNNQPNDVTVDCNITVPMEFGENFAINFSEIEGGLDDIFSDVSVQEAAIIASYTTTLPLDLEFTINPLQEISAEEYNRLPSDEKLLDDDDEEYPEYYRILKNVGFEILNADQNGKGIITGTTDMSLVDPAPSMGKIVIRLTEKEKDALKSLTHLQYSVAGNLTKGLESGALRSTQYLQMKLSAKIAKIEVDIDSL